MKAWSNLRSTWRPPRRPRRGGAVSVAVMSAPPSAKAAGADASATRRPPEAPRATSLHLQHRRLLGRLVLLRGDLALVAELRELGHLVRRRIAGGPPLTLLRGLDHLLVLLRHLRPRDHVDQQADERQDEDQQDPPGLAQPGDVVAPEDVGEDRDEDPDDH